MSESAVSLNLVQQRIRNRIIEVLENFSSFENQRRYQKDVPICYVPYELINSWGDWVGEARPKEFGEPVFSKSELDAINIFHSALEKAIEILPDDYPPLEELLKQRYWVDLRNVAKQALASFEVRGKLSEDDEIA